MTPFTDAELSLMADALLVMHHEIEGEMYDEQQEDEPDQDSLIRMSDRLDATIATFEKVCAELDRRGAAA